MSINSRKPVCPACAGVGHWHATLLDPAEDCEVCGGFGRVNKRTARRLRKRAQAYKQWKSSYVPRLSTLPTNAEIDDILNSITF